MAEAVNIHCPVCNEKFKSTADKEGKKVRCPNCDEPFHVTEEMISFPRKDKPARTDKRTEKGEVETAVVAKPPPEPVPQPAPAPVPTRDDDELDDDGNPYGIQQVDVKPRCPVCAKEMASEKAFICVYCGYNTLTREIGKTARTFSLTFEERLKHLTPALTAVAFAVLLVIFLIWFCIVYPTMFRTGFLHYLASEPARLFLTIFLVGFIYGSGYYGLKQIIFNPKPKEREKEK